jgi:hypothetical protein
MHLKRIAIAVALAAGTFAIAVPATASPDGVDKILTTKMNGNKEFPGPGDGNGKGEFAATLSDGTLCYSFWAKKIAAPTAAHIHEAPAGASGPVVVTLILPTESGVSTCVAPPADVVDGLMANSSDYYVNVHNAAFPAGAIRGQL